MFEHLTEHFCAVFVSGGQMGVKLQHGRGHGAKAHGSAELWLSKDCLVVSFNGWRKLLGGRRMSFPVRFSLSSQHPEGTKPWLSDTHLYAGVEVQMLRSVDGCTTFCASSAVLSVPVRELERFTAELLLARLGLAVWPCCPQCCALDPAFTSRF